MHRGWSISFPDLLRQGDKGYFFGPRSRVGHIGEWYNVMQHQNKGSIASIDF